MISQVLADESVQVLVFVVLPLVLLLSGIVIYGAFRPNNYVASFPTFSVRINFLAHDVAYVVYGTESKIVEFEAKVGRRGRLIYVRAPKELPEEDLRDILPFLVQGLTRLRYAYVIYRNLEPQKIPEAEREAAIAELQRMGVSLGESVGQRQVQRAVIHNLPRSTAEQTKATISKVQDLMATARGVRETTEVLASSGRATSV